MTRTQQIDVVRKLVEDYCSREMYLTHGFTPSDDEYQHILNIAESVLCTKWNVGYPGGSFVQAVVDNNLQLAFSRADYINRKYIPLYIGLMQSVSCPSELTLETQFHNDR
jgi:hypothetical protein